MKIYNIYSAKADFYIIIIEVINANRYCEVLSVFVPFKPNCKIYFI